MSQLSTSLRTSSRRLTRGQWIVLGLVIVSDLGGMAAMILGHRDLGRPLIGLGIIAIGPYAYWTRRTNQPAAQHPGQMGADGHQGAMQPTLGATYAGTWAATSSAIDAAADQRLDAFNDETIALYDPVPRRQLAFMCAHFTLIGATKDLIGHTPTRQDIDTLAQRLEPEWETFRMADAVHLLNALVCANLGNKAGQTVFERTPRLEHTLVAAALVLRHVERRTDFYRDYVAGVMERNSSDLPSDWFRDDWQG